MRGWDAHGNKHGQHMAAAPIDIGDGTIMAAGHGGGGLGGGHQLPNMLGMMMMNQMQMGQNIQNIMNNMGGNRARDRKRGQPQIHEMPRAKPLFIKEAPSPQALRHWGGVGVCAPPPLHQDAAHPQAGQM